MTLVLERVPVLIDFKPFLFLKYFKTVLVEVTMKLNYNLYFKRVTPITLKSILPGGPSPRGEAEKGKNQFQFSKSVSRSRS